VPPTQKCVKVNGNFPAFQYTLESPEDVDSDKRGKDQRRKERSWGGAANQVLTSLTLHVNDAECATSNFTLGELGKWVGVRQA
jgi:hypothetical protein